MIYKKANNLDRYKSKLTCLLSKTNKSYAME